MPIEKEVMTKLKTGSNLYKTLQSILTSSYLLKKKKKSEWFILVQNERLKFKEVTPTKLFLTDVKSLWLKLNISNENYLGLVSIAQTASN